MIFLLALRAICEWVDQCRKRKRQVFRGVHAGRKTQITTEQLFEELR
jgi:hypothetical protein